MSFVFEALFANCLESSGIPLDYEVNVNANNNSSVDFCFQKREYGKFCFELLRPEMKDELKKEFETIDDQGFYGISLSRDHEKEYLRPEAQTIYLQEKLLEKVDKFPALQETDCYSTIVVDCSNIHFGHFDEEDCRMVMFGRTANPINQEEWLHHGKKHNILGLLEHGLKKRNAKAFREKVTSVIFIPEISLTLLKDAYVTLNIHRVDSHQRRFKNTLLNMSPFQNLHWIEMP